MSSARPHQAPITVLCNGRVFTADAARTWASAVAVRGGQIVAVGGEHTAVDDVSFTVPAGRTLALVGESGAGKPTIGAVLSGLHPATSGVVEVCGEDRTRPARSTRAP